MKKNLTLRLLVASILVLFSCRNDDLLSPAEKEASQNALLKEGSSLSFWKEDETYIRKVQEVYTQYANENYIHSTHGTILWEYAMTMNTFSESYLIAPVVKEGKVVKTLEVFRVKNKVYFQFSDKDPDANGFFQALVFTERNKISASVAEGKYTSKSGTISIPVCRKFILTVGYVEGAGGEQYPIQETKTICKFVETALPVSDCLGDVDPITGECGGGGPGGYGYPDPPDTEVDPCEKTKNKIADPKFKAKFQELNTPEMFAMDHEKGYYERLPPVGSTGISSGFPVVDGAPCTHGMDLPDNENGIAGLMHIHNDVNCDGNPSVKVPSPSDVRTFLNIFMKQARLYTGSYTNAYSVVITSQGSYMLQYTNDTWPGSTWDKLDDWNKWYKKEYDKLIRDDKFTQENVEKVFTQFLEEKVAIEGLEVYKITENSSTKLKYNGANQPVTATPCPQ